MIYIIGLGITGKSSLSRRALTIIESANILIGGRRHLACFPELKGRKLAIGSNLNEIVKILSSNSKFKTPNSSVVLATGDPNFFGIAEFITNRFGKDSVEIIPNVTTMQEAFAMIKESWNDARFLSLHGRERNIDEVVDEVIGQEKIGIFTDPDNTPSRIAKVLFNRGIKNYRVYVFEGLGTEYEKVTEGILSQIAKRKFSPLNVMVLIRVQSPESRAHKIFPYSLGIPDSEFSHSKGMITKEEIRIVTLSKLRLHKNCILWDIGAGCGSLSIEAVLLFPSAKIYAIERDPIAFKFIEKNIERFSTKNIHIVPEEAPEALEFLPDPDAVFIGGSGGKLNAILKIACEKIRSGGSIVVNAVTLDTLIETTGFFNYKGWETEVVAINISRTKELKGKKAFESHNPVYIISGKKL